MCGVGFAFNNRWNPRVRVGSVGAVVIYALSERLQCVFRNKQFGTDSSKARQCMIDLLKLESAIVASTKELGIQIQSAGNSAQLPRNQG